MKLKFLINESLQALRSNLLRSFLTIIGIVVGIFSVTAMLALGEGLSENILDRFNSFASGDVSVSGEISYRDFSWMTEQPYVKNSLATVSVENVQVIAFGTEFSPSIQAVVGDYAELKSYELVSGDVFDWSDSSFDEAVAVVSDSFSEVVEEGTGRTVLNEEITIGGTKYKVIGIIQANSGFGRGDGNVTVPYERVVGTLTSSKNFSEVGILLKDASYFDIAGQALLEGLNASRQLAHDNEDFFSVETSQSFIESAQETTQIISLFLGIVGGIALFVGGIGTMNMMLTTVTERTKEIGLRKAVGARDRDIMLQILIESVSLTSLGGFIGILLSFGAAEIANTIFSDSEIIKVLISTEIVMLAACVAVAVGVVFGLYPARNASKLQPVDALRSE